MLFAEAVTEPSAMTVSNLHATIIDLGVQSEAITIPSAMWQEKKII